MCVLKTMNDLLELDRSQARVQILTFNALARARARFPSQLQR